MIALVRVDDRLIHAQVVVGWIEYLRSARVVVADDSIADDIDRIELFRMVLPQDIALDVISLRDLSKSWNDLHSAKESVLVLFSNVLSLGAAVGLGIRPREVNLGGLHEGPGKKSWIHGLYASDEEISAIRMLIGMGIDFEIRSVPAARRREVEGLL